MTDPQSGAAAPRRNRRPARTLAAVAATLRATAAATVAAAVAAAVLLLAAGPARADDFRTGDVVIKHPYAAATRAGAKNGAVYLMSLETAGSTPDRLIRASSPASAKVELHTMSMAGDVMRMREVESIPVTPGQPLVMKPGTGYHLMLIDLKAPLKEDDAVELTLEFERAGRIEITAPVHEVAATGHKH